MHNNNWLCNWFALNMSICNVLVEQKWLWLDVLFNGGTSAEESFVWLSLNVQCKLIIADLTLCKMLSASFQKNLIVKTKACKTEAKTEVEQNK